MKMKKVVLLLTASLLLSGCDYLNDILGELSSLGGTSSEDEEVLPQAVKQVRADNDKINNFVNFFIF